MIYSLAPQYVMYGSQKYLAQVRNYVLEYPVNVFADLYECSSTPAQMVSVDGGWLSGNSLSSQALPAASQHH